MRSVNSAGSIWQNADLISQPISISSSSYIVVLSWLFRADMQDVYTHKDIKEKQFKAIGL